MKKYIPAIIFLVGFLIISSLYTPLYYNKYLAMSKEVTTTIEIDHFIEDPEIRIPTYEMDQNNPYLHVANQTISLERSKQYGEWDAYYIIISPTRLSDSTCFQISISCISTDQNKSSDLTWTKKNITADFRTSENYPEGEYTTYIGTFHQGTYAYEISGFVFGSVDNNRDQEIVEELEYLVEGLE